MSSSENSEKVADLIRGNRIAMLTTRSPEGRLTSRPMALQDVEFDGSVWFFADRRSTACEHVAADSAVNVAVGSGSTWVSLAGTATVVEDDARKKELWNAGVAAWFPDGPDADHIVLLNVDADTAEYWDSPGGRIATLLSFAKAKATGKPYEGGENEVVDL